MPKMTVSNLHSDKPILVWLEPYGEDYWIPPKDVLSFEFDAADFTEGVIDSGEFDVAWTDNGIVLWPAALNGVTVHDRSGNKVECGHQRPPEA